MGYNLLVAAALSANLVPCGSWYGVVCLCGTPPPVNAAIQKKKQGEGLNFVFTDSGCEACFGEEQTTSQIHMLRHFEKGGDVII